MILDPAGKDKTMARKTARKKRRTTKKKTPRKKTVRRPSSRSRGKSTPGRVLVTAAALLGGIAVGWIVVSWYQDRTQPVISRTIPVNVTARGEMLVEIPSRQQVAALSTEERERVEQEVVAALAQVPNPANEPRPGNSVTIAQGRFQGSDEAHPASGSVQVLKAAGIRLIVRLDDFRVTNGPSLHVYIVEDPEIPLHNSADLGPLRGTTGAQNYQVSTHDDLGADQMRYLIVYDELFGRTYAVARLERTEQWEDRFWYSRG